MYKRDAAIVLLSCLAVLVSLQHEGSFSFRKAWYHAIPDAASELYVGHHDLPSPVVADLNGDGHLEIVTATHDLKIRVLQPQPSGRQGEGFAPARVINEQSLLYKRVLMAAGRRAVALAVGYIDTAPQERVRPPRKQVVVVVTASWQVLCFDHNLKLLWEKDVKERLPPHSHIKEVAVYVSAHQVQVGDHGLIVVGASVERGDPSSGLGLESTDGTADSAARVGGDEELLLSQMRTEDEQVAHAHSAGSKDKLSDVDSGDAVKGVDGSRHFSYVAMEGGSGTERWHHSSTDFHKDLDALATQMRPQVDYRLDAEKMEGRHFGEASCREYRESLLHVLPHAWTRPADTRLEEAHFVKHRHGRGPHKEGLAVKATTHGAAGAGGAARSSLKQPSAGLLGLLGTGGRRHAPQDPHAHGGAHNHHNHGKGLMHGGHNVTANALVAFLEEGMEVIHLYSGRTLCKLHLPPGVLHADLNGDGVMDHVQVHHGEETEAEEAGVAATAGSLGHAAPQHCKATVMSGVPAAQKLFSVSVCRSHGSRFRSSWGAGVLGSRTARSLAQPTELLTPIMLPIPETGRGYTSHRAQHGLIIFLTNKGEATAVTSTGSHLWQNYYPVAWPHSSVAETVAASGEDAAVSRAVPTLVAMALRRHAVPTAILAAGISNAAIISEHGNTLDVLTLPAAPTQPLVVVDFNGDGLNDIILVTAEGIYGFVQVQHLGGFTLSALLVTLILSLGIVYYTQLYDGTGAGTKRAKKLRSTDFID